jgi:ketopantoate reductase
MKVAVLGSGAGALAVAADMSRHGRHTVMADLDGERDSLEPIRATGTITVTSTSEGAGTDEGTHSIHTYPVVVADSVAEALAGAELAVTVARVDARERWARAIAPHTTPDHTVLFLGEGGGAIVARRIIEPPTVVAETNTLPHRARTTGPATVDVVPK